MIDKNHAETIFLFTNTYLEQYLLHKKHAIEEQIKQNFYLGIAQEFTFECFNEFINENTKDFFIKVDLENITLVEKHTQDYPAHEIVRVYAYPFSGNLQLLDYNTNGIVIDYGELRERFGKVEVNTTKTHLLITLTTPFQDNEEQTKKSIINRLKNFNEYVALHTYSINRHIAYIMNELKNQYNEIHHNLQFDNDIVDIMKNMKM